MAEEFVISNANYQQFQTLFTQKFLSYFLASLRDNDKKELDCWHSWPLVVPIIFPGGLKKFQVP